MLRRPVPLFAPTLIWLAASETIGVAVSGSTAERLGADSPALAGSTLTLDALVARANTGTVRVGPDTTVFFDEAGMSTTSASTPSSIWWSARERS